MKGTYKKIRAIKGHLNVFVFIFLSIEEVKVFLLTRSLVLGATLNVRGANFILHGFILVNLLLRLVFLELARLDSSVLASTLGDLVWLIWRAVGLFGSIGSISGGNLATGRRATRLSSTVPTKLAADLTVSGACDSGALEACLSSETSPVNLSLCECNNTKKKVILNLHRACCGCAWP
jgi:hypothetical protein